MQYDAVNWKICAHFFDAKHIALLKLAVQIFLIRSQGRKSVIIVAILIVNHWEDPQRFLSYGNNDDNDDGGK